MNISFLRLDVEVKFDLILAICGYETRSRCLLDSNTAEGAIKVAVGYSSAEELAFAENKASFERAGYKFVAVADDDYETYIESLVREARKCDSSSLKVLLDISCFTRRRLAQTVEALFESGPFEIEVFYSLAAFEAPGIEEPQTEYLCPVTEYLSGWTGDADKAVVLISGLGYEQMMALGIMEHIDPYDLWLFSPDSLISDYDEEVAKANQLLLSSVAKSNVLHYPVMDGDVLLSKLVSLVDSLRRDYRCILMPLGPKVFAFASIVVGCIYRDVSVWRASAGVHRKAKDRLPSGHTSSFRLAFSRNDDAAEMMPDGLE